MQLNPFPAFSLWANLIFGAIAAVLIWFAGTKLERHVATIAKRTGLSKAFMGLLILATVTSLPEIATVGTAILEDNIDLATHNLLGGVVAQTAVLALADLYLREGTLTRFAPKYVLLLEGVGLVQLLAVTIITIVLADTVALTVNIQERAFSFAPAPLALVVVFIVLMYLSYRSEGHARWRPTESTEEEAEAETAVLAEVTADDEALAEEEEEEREEAAEERSLSPLVLPTLLASLAVIIGGWAAASIGDTLAEQTGLGSSFVGFTLVSIATSLPEVSTVFSAVRNGNYDMAVSNIFGSNSFDVTLLFLVALFTGGRLLSDSSPTSALFAAALGIIMTCVYLWGLLEREDESLFGVGWDSVVVLLLYVAGTALIFFLR